MAEFEQLDAISAPGTENRPNEDRFASGRRFGLAIDGATGLGDARLIEQGETDAGWLAAEAAALIADGLDAENAADTPTLLRATMARLRERLTAAMAARAATGPRRIEAAPAFALPTAAFQMLRAVPGAAPGRLETAGLGDCALFLLDADGAFWRATGSDRGRAMEREAARAALEIAGGLDEAAAFRRQPAVLERLRRARSVQNQPGGAVWTLGTEPLAADHLALEQRTVRLPAMALLATDGFADLVDAYGAYDGEGLLRAAAGNGLAPLLAQLRHIETEIDPSGARFPRFKRSDDATALLLRLR